MDNEKKQVTYNSSITGETQVTFDIQQYMNNGQCLLVLCVMKMDMRNLLGM